MLFSNEELRPKFKELLKFPGLLDGLQLGNLHKHLGLHCDEQIGYYLDHICRTWNTFTHGDKNIASATDIDTVRALEFLAPSASAHDRQQIMALMKNSTLWKRVTDPTARYHIQFQVLSTQVVISSLTTMHENMKYLLLG